MQLKAIKSADKKLWCSNRYKRSVARTLNNIISIRAVKCSTSCSGVIFMQLRYCFQCAFQDVSRERVRNHFQCENCSEKFLVLREVFLLSGSNFHLTAQSRTEARRGSTTRRLFSVLWTYVLLMFHLGSHFCSTTTKIDETSSSRHTTRVMSLSAWTIARCTSTRMRNL